jgi:phosphoglycerol transferase MdoB-like AlkP superfamily enzyme
MRSYKFKHIKLLTHRLLLLLAVYFICRLIFYVYNFQSFSNSSFADIGISFLAGIIFDLSAIVYINLIYVLFFIPTLFTKTNKVYEQFLEIIFIGLNFIAILFNIIDIEYYRFQKKRTGIELFSGENDIIKLLPTYLKDYWWLLIISTAITYFLFKYYRKTREVYLQENKPYTALKILSIIIYIGILVIIARGGLQTKPIQIISASQYGNPQNSSLTLNTTFTILHSYGKKTLDIKNYFSEEQLNLYINTHRNYKSELLFSPKNVVIIILESFSNEYIGAINKNVNYTPFLDSLFNESYVFENAFSNGKKSNEAMPSIIASIPSLIDESYTGSIYQNNEINTLPNLLKSKGYYSMFFHGGFNGSMNFDAFAKKAGYDQYFGMNEYNNTSDYDGNWGIYDEPFFNYFAQTLGSAPKPFFATMFSLSSHPPFAIPSEYKDKFKHIKSEKHRSFAYTDYALKKFFEYAKTKKWYYNTLFVILPDHTPDADDLYYDTKVSYYKIPIVFFDPVRNWNGKSSKIVSQIDVMPSILDYLNFDSEFKSFGKSVWRNEAENYSINYRDGIYQLIDSNYVLQYSKDEVTGLYMYTNDWYLTNNLIDTQPDIWKKMKIKLEAFIQNYNATLIHNTYYIKP